MSEPGEMERRSAEERAEGVPPRHSVLGFLADRGGRAPRVSLHGEGSGAEEAPLVDPRSAENHGVPAGRGNYQLLGEIARGGMGVVLRGRDTDLGRDVALKVLHERFKDDRGVLERFVEEAQIGGQLQHPGIVPVYELGLMDDERPYFTMKLVKGKTLAALFAERADASEEREHLLEVFLSVARTMAYAHARGVIHRDLKPSNVMVGAFGEVQVVDWGLAKVLARGGVADEARAKRDASERTILETVRSGEGSEGSSHSLVGSVLGTPGYMPPEQAQGAVEKLDERSDVFALGAILCELLTGEPPYPGDALEAVQAAANAELEDAHARLAACGADRDLVDLATECMRPAQLARPANAGVVAKRLEAFQRSKEERIRAAEVATAVQRRAKWIWSLLVAVVLAFVGTGLFLRERRVQAAQERQQRIASEIRDASLEASLLRDRAREAGSVALWDQARAAAERARTIATTEGVTDTAAVDALLEELAAGREETLRAADCALRAEAFCAKIDAIAGGSLDLLGVDADREATTAAYREAFASVGLDLARLAPEDAVDAFRAAGLLDGDHRQARLATALEGWIRVVLDAPNGQLIAEHLADLADRFDDEPVRRTLREAVRSFDTVALRDLARSPDATSAAPGSILLLIKLLNRIGEAGNAAGLLLEGRRAHPEDFSMNLGAGLVHLFAGDELWRTLPYFVAAESIRPERPSARFFEAASLAVLGRTDLARVALDDAIARASEDELHTYAVVYVNGLQTRKELALLDGLEALLAERPDETKLRGVRIPMLLARGRFAEAVPLLHAYLARHPDAGSQVRRDLASALVALDRDGEAVAVLRAALDREPDDPSLLVGLSWTLSIAEDPDARHPEEAVRLAERALAITPDVPDYVEALGVATLRAGNPEDALGLLDATKDLLGGHTNPEIEAFRALALAQLGDQDGARTAAQFADRLIRQALARNTLLPTGATLLARLQNELAGLLD